MLKCNLDEHVQRTDLPTDTGRRLEYYEYIQLPRHIQIGLRLIVQDAVILRSPYLPSIEWLNSEKELLEAAVLERSL